MGKSDWMREHTRDPYVRQAKQEGWRSRAALKLQQIDQAHRLFRNGMVVVDLGAAPGGWSQYAARQVGAAGKVLAIDLLAMEPIEKVDFLHADFAEMEGLEALRARLAGRAVDLVMSDMAPNLSGIRAADQARSIELVELAIAFADEQLKTGGDLLMKVFEGAGLEPVLRQLKSYFDTLVRIKPAASRSKSREWYALARRKRRC